MPYRMISVEPDQYMDAAQTGEPDSGVWHVYKNDDYDQGPREYWYTVNPQADDTDYSAGESGIFDVRTLPNPSGHSPHTDDGRKAIIREAFASGHFNGWPPTA